MAEELDLGAKLQEDAINNVSQSVGTGFDGLTPSVESIDANVKSIKDEFSSGWFFETLNSILDNNKSQSEKQEKRDIQNENTSAAIDHICEVADLDRNDTVNNNTKKTKTSGLKVDDLKDLNATNGLGFALISTQIADIANTLKKKNDSSGGGGKISGWFAGLMEGVAGIAGLAVALLIFAGATAVFQLVNWSDALIGMLSFTAFTIGMVVLAKAVKGEKDNLMEFAAASMIMSGALAVFAISLAISSYIIKNQFFKSGPFEIPAIDIAAAIIGVGTFLTFILGLAVVAKVLNNNGENFNKFALGSLVLSAALSVFSISLAITSAMVKGQLFDSGVFKIPAVDLIAAAKGTGMFLLFLTGLAVVARIAGNNVANFTKFAMASMLMSVSLVVFSVAAFMVGHILEPGQHKIFGLEFAGTDIVSAIAGTALFVGFLLGMAVVGNVASSVIGPMAMLSLVSVLMSFAVASFGIGLTTLILAMNGGKAKLFGQDWDFGPADGAATRFGLAMAGLGSMVLFFGAFAAAGYAAIFVGGLAALFSGVVITIAIATAMGASALGLASLLGNPNGGSMKIAGQEYTVPIHNDEDLKRGMNSLVLLMSSFADLGEGRSWSGILKSALIGKAIMPVIDAMEKAANVIVTGMTMKQRVIKEYGESAWDLNVLDHMLDPVLAIVLGKNLDGTGGLVKVADNLSWFALAKLHIFNETLAPIIDTISKGVNSIKEGITLNKSLADAGIDIKDENNVLFHVLDPILFMVMGPNMDGEGGMAKAANELGFFARKRLANFNEVLAPIISAVSDAVKVVKDAANMGSKADVDKALNNIEYLMIGTPYLKKGQTYGIGPFKIKMPDYYAPGGVLGLVTALSSYADGIPSGVADSFKSTAEVVTASGEVTKAVKELAKTTKEEIDKCILVMNSMGSFLEVLKWVILVVPEEKKMKKAIKSFDTVNEVISKSSSAVDEIAKLTPKLTILSDLPDLYSFYKSAGYLKDGLERIAWALFGWSDKKVNLVSGIGDALYKISNASNSLKLDAYDKLLSRTSDLKLTAEQLNKIAEAFERMSKASMLDRITGVVDNIQNKTAEMFNWTDKESPSEIRGEMSASNVSTKEAVNKMLDILINWERNGVNVNGISAPPVAQPQQSKPKAISSKF